MNHRIQSSHYHFIIGEYYFKNFNKQHLMLTTSLWISTKDVFGYCLFSWKLKNWKHCSKIIFQCMNSVVRPIFNKSFVEKRDL